MMIRCTKLLNKIISHGFTSSNMISFLISTQANSNLCLLCMSPSVTQKNRGEKNKQSKNKRFHFIVIFKEAAFKCHFKIPAKIASLWKDCVPRLNRTQLCFKRGKNDTGVYTWIKTLNWDWDLATMWGRAQEAFFLICVHTHIEFF